MKQILSWLQLVTKKARILSHLCYKIYDLCFELQCEWWWIFAYWSTWEGHRVIISVFLILFFNARTYIFKIRELAVGVILIYRLYFVSYLPKMIKRTNNGHTYHKLHYSGCYLDSRGRCSDCGDNDYERFVW